MNIQNLYSTMSPAENESDRVQEMTSIIEVCMFQELDYGAIHALSQIAMLSVCHQQ